jgi:hypothetical protein
MRHNVVVSSLAVVLLFVQPIAGSALFSQANPFKLSHGKVSAVQVDYAFAGNVTGTGQRTVSADRVLDHQTTTGKFFGKTSTNDTWTLMTADSVYTADLTRKTGSRGPNMLPVMARAYDDLDGAGKHRLQQNLQDMSQMIARAFGTGTIVSGEKGETKTYAGEKCDERTFGSFSICTMQGAAAVPLHVSGSLLCVDFEQTATAVRKGEPAASAFAPPSGIVFHDAVMGNVDSLARGYVQYLASQALADSLAAAKARLASAPATSAPASGPAPAPTAEERAQQRQACEALRNFDLGREMRAATNRVLGDAVRDALKEKQNQVEAGARDKVKGFIRRPHF